MVKNLPAMQETWVQSLGREDPLEKGMATHSSWPGELHRQRSPVGYGVAKSQTQLSDFHSLHTNLKAKILTKTIRTMN